MTIIKSVIYFIIVFGAIVVIHELGHLIAAKSFGVYCDEFSFGMGPKLFGFKGKETRYNVRAFPLGGFVSMAGEADAEFDDAAIPEERTIGGISKWKQIVVMLAGIFMNLVLGLVVAISINLIAQQRVVMPEPIIASVNAGSPAAQAGLLEGDIITEVIYEGNVSIKPTQFAEIGQYMSLYQGEKTTFIVDRNEKQLSFEIEPQFDQETNRYLIGIVGQEAEIVDVNFVNSLKFGWQDFKQNANMIVDSLKFLVKGKGLNQVSGPIGILDITGQAMNQTTSFKEGLLTLLSLISLLSVNLGLFNLIPVPMFDGGRVVMVLYEMITKRKVNEKVENGLMLGSLLLVLAIFVFSTWNDISRLIFR